MDATTRTNSLQRLMIPVTDLEPQDLNPNEMTDAEFNMLYDNVEQMGVTDAILVRRKTDDEVTAEKPAPYRIVGGYHRWEVAKLHGMDAVPCTVVTDPAFDADREKFQVVRMNVIRGHLSPEKFMKMYQTLSEKYADEIMAESFGFADEQEFRKLIAKVTKELPAHLKDEFKKAASDLKTIDDLSKLLQRLFTSYGDTLPYGFMVFDFGGKESTWLRMDAPTKKALQAVCAMCVEKSRTVDDIIGGMIRLMSEGKLDSHLVQLIASSDAVEIPEGTTTPTKEILSGAIVEAAGAMI
jgi:hypothetical protein